MFKGNSGKIGGKLVERCRKSLLCIISIIFIVFLSTCADTNNIILSGEAVDIAFDDKSASLSYDDETESLVTDKLIEKSVDDESNETIVAEFAGIGGPSVALVCFDTVSFDDFENNSMLCEKSNEMIQRSIIYFILHIYDLKKDYDNIRNIVDEDGSRDWYATVLEVWISRDPENREGMTIIDKMNNLRNHYREFSISIISIQMNFMMRLVLDGDKVFVSVPVYNAMDGIEIGYALYEFEFIKIDGDFKAIGLAVGA